MKPKNTYHSTKRFSGKGVSSLAKVVLLHWRRLSSTCARTILFITTLITLLTSNVLHAQTDCKALLKDYHQKMASYSVPKKGQAYYMNMTMESHFKKSAGVKNTFSKIEAYVTEDKVFYISDYVSMYIDQEEVISVVHPQKVILRSDISEEGWDKIARMNEATALQDSLLTKSKLISCEEVTEAGVTYMKIVLEPDAATKQRHHIKNMVYLYDAKAGQLKKAITHYNAESQRSKDIVTYNDIDFNYDKRSLKSAYQEVFGNKTKSRYSDYEVIDNRKK